MEASDLLERLPFVSHGFKFREKIGCGSYSAVFKVEHMISGQFYAAKAIPLALTRSELIDSEMNTLLMMDHSSITKFYSYFSDHGYLFMILQLCEKGTIEQFVTRNEGMPDTLLWAWMKTILIALEYIHSKKVAHRDIKPQNIFIDQHNRPILGDFGFAKITNDDTLSQDYNGSFMFKSPETLKKIPHNAFKSDIWSLGVTFLIMMTGIDPWPMTSMNEQLTAILEGKYNVPNNFDPDKARIIDMMLRLDPNRRTTIKQLLEEPKIKTSSLRSYTRRVSFVTGRKSDSPLQQEHCFKALQKYSVNTKTNYYITVPKAGVLNAPIHKPTYLGLNYPLSKSSCNILSSKSGSMYKKKHDILD